MTVINEYKDPMSGKVNHFAKGSIKHISIKPVKNADQDGVKRTHIPAKNGQPAKVIEATHSISFLMQAVDDQNNVVDPAGQGEWIGMGEKKLHPSHADKVQVKIGEAYKDILTGIVVSFPLKVSTNGDKTYVNGSLNGKTFNILDESKAGAVAPRGNSTPTSNGAVAQAGGSVKIYGEITALNGNTATVLDEKLGSGYVILSDEQVAQIAVGGRMTAFIVPETGVIVSGFKAYGPVGQNQGSSGKGKGKYDPTGVSTGHAINVLANLKLAGFKGDLLDAGKVAHEVTTKLIKEFSDASGKDEGNSVGNAVKFAATVVSVKGKTIDAGELETEARKAFQTLSVPLKDFITSATAVEPQGSPQGVTEPLVKPTQQEVPPVTGPQGSWEPGMDFDDDIPF